MEGGKIEAVCNPVVIRAIVWTGFALGEGLVGCRLRCGRVGRDSVIARLIPGRSTDREAGHSSPASVFSAAINTRCRYSANGLHARSRSIAKPCRCQGPKDQRALHGIEKRAAIEHIKPSPSVLK